MGDAQALSHTGRAEYSVSVRCLEEVTVREGADGLLMGVGLLSGVVDILGNWVVVVDVWLQRCQSQRTTSFTRGDCVVCGL